jgi:hypothetical protein
MMQLQPHWRQTLLRTEKTAQAYEQYIKKRTSKSGCPLCESNEVFKEYEHWVLMHNKFPYDRYFSKSDMLVPKRHITEGQVSDVERAEFIHLKRDVLFTDYDSIIEHFPEQKSIPEHVHYHLVQYKREEAN